MGTKQTKKTQELTGPYQQIDKNKTRQTGYNIARQKRTDQDKTEVDNYYYLPSVIGNCSMYQQSPMLVCSSSELGNFPCKDRDILYFKP